VGVVDRPETLIGVDQSTWLDAAGVPPKIASVLMGHAAPTKQAGAAPITLARYTRALPQDIERAGELLGSYLAARQAKEASTK
jgi:hypothetical protein